MDLSIIIPTYKTGKYFLEAINSVDKQMPENYLIEIIVVLNGEKKPYMDIVNSIKPKCKYKVLYTEIEGVSNARNIGIEHAAGKYILFLDDDDLLSENYLNQLLQLVQDKYTLYVSNVKCFKDGTNKYYDDYIGEFIEKIDNFSQNHQNIFKYRKIMSSSWCKLISKELISNAKFNTDLSISEDALFMFEISNRIKNIVICKDIFYYRRIRKNSATTIRKNRIIHIQNYYKFSYFLTIVYFKNIFHYNVIFYLSRLAASFKMTINNLK